METFNSEKEFYEHFLTQGKLIPGDSGECADIKKVPWFNEKQFLEGIAFALTQLAAIQVLVLSPEAVGMSKEDCDKGLEGYIHVWAVIGKMLGMEDRFNICLYNRPSIIPDHVTEWFIPLLQEVNEHSVLLQEATIEASGMVVPFVFNFKSIWLHLIKEVLPSAWVNIIWNSMTLGEKFKYCCLKLILVLARLSRFSKMIINLYLLVCKVMLWGLNK